jgi:hypothetical protein
LFDVMIGSILV